MAKKRYTKRYNSFTGQKERVLKNGYYRDPYNGKIKKSRMHYNTQNKPMRNLTKGEKKILFIGGIILALCIIFYDLLLWAVDHLMQIFIAVLVLCVIVILMSIFIKPLRERTLRNLFGISKNNTDKEINDLIKAIKSIKVQDIRNEDDFEKQLYQRLDAKDYNVRRQVIYGSGKRVDLVVDNRIGIELKVADKSKNIQDLIGQVTVYKKHLDKIIVGILDCKKVNDLDEYIELIENVDKDNVFVVVVNGHIRRRKKKKEEYIIIKKQ